MRRLPEHEEEPDPLYAMPGDDAYESDEAPTLPAPPRHHEPPDPNPTRVSGAPLPRSHEEASQLAHLALIEERTESLDGRVERIEGSGKELVGVARAALLWLRVFVCGMLALGAGFLGVAVIGVGAALLR